MINFLPQLYDNELFYSVIARYRRMCGMVSGRAFIRDLFGEFVVITSSNFPQYIRNFIGNLPPTSKVTTKEIIEKHTLFNFYTSFLNEEKADHIYETMGKGSNGSRLNVEQQIGFGGSKVRKPSYLRYCPLCFKEDIDTLGESYWRINHQIIGAYYCSKHHVLLKESSVLSTGNGIEFICADEQICNEELLEDNYSDTIKLLNLEYIHNAELILNRNFSRKDLNYIIDFYIDRLREKRLASKNGNLYMKDVQERFLHFYPKQYLELMQSSINPDSPSNWLRLFVRHNKGNRSPVRHLLFLQFLSIDPPDLLLSEKVVGKKKDSIVHNPSFDLNQRREKWLKLITENPGANRSQLKDKGKGLHTWVYKYDWDWYDKVTPKAQLGKEKAGTIDWEKRDEECLSLAMEAVEFILQRKGKPIRVTPSSIRNILGFGPWFHNVKLVGTQRYLHEVKEDINDFRIRKIKWALNEMVYKGDRITPYKVQLYAGFGGSNKEVRKLILKELVWIKK
ncbi:TniQ family protein [Virgibacillus dakarensis]|uniref:TnsD family Tn7-like transposition protein n=1 Tax=Cytobacillus kochii TaxID=859143 RepID=UPI000C840378|nr:TnsD family Tn7-like transposition protein [Cytobacillus kochii]MBT2217988.1 TniQ family protein [Virgibacillus dakarensis]MCA1025045.1 TnsD family transposase [Cytobacillus kochii]